MAAQNVQKEHNYHIFLTNANIKWLHDFINTIIFKSGHSQMFMTQIYLYQCHHKTKIQDATHHAHGI